MDLKRCLMIAGGSVDDTSASLFLKKYTYEWIIAVDGGLTAARRLQLIPDFAVGDFDSVSPEVYAYFQKQEGISWETHPPEKDASDTELALWLALRLGAESIHLWGATGTRLDHTLGAIGLLQIPLKAGVDCSILDAHNRITMIDSKRILKKAEAFGRYVSLIPYTETVRGVTLKGMKYPLDNAVLTHGNTLSISNEIVEEEAVIEICEGQLLVIESQD